MKRGIQIRWVPHWTILDRTHRNMKSRGSTTVVHYLFVRIESQTIDENRLGCSKTQGFLGAFAIFDVGRDPIPLDDVSIFTSERHSAIQLPGVEAIGADQGVKRTPSKRNAPLRPPPRDIRLLFVKAKTECSEGIRLVFAMPYARIGYAFVRIQCLSRAEREAQR
jgi:hypothetical protein